jgi:hypothetical protein
MSIISIVCTLVILDLSREKLKGIWAMLDKLHLRIVEMDRRDADFVLYFENVSALVDARHLFTNKIGWSIPSKTAIKTIASVVGDGLILSIGSGMAYWEQLLNLYRVKVVASDQVRPTRLFFEGRYEEMEASDAVRGFPEATALFVNWPREFASSALPHFKGRYVISIGENGHDGCTGDIGGILEDSAEWREIAEVEIPRWNGIYDNLVIFERVSVDLD